MTETVTETDVRDALLRLLRRCAPSQLPDGGPWEYYLDDPRLNKNKNEIKNETECL